MQFAHGTLRNTEMKLMRTLTIEDLVARGSSTRLANRPAFGFIQQNEWQRQVRKKQKPLSGLFAFPLMPGIKPARR
jgi:hypothetical protein